MRRNQRLDIPLSEDEDAVLQEAAALMPLMTKTSFGRWAVMNTARGIIATSTKAALDRARAILPEITKEKNDGK
jgi:uncharacterized protein (DUF1778 family)